MHTQTEHFRVTSKAQDKIKIPGVFWAGLKAIGVSAAAVLRQSKLSPAIRTGEGLVNTAELFSIWRSIGELSTDLTVGWRFMSEVETDQYHPTLMAALHARTYRECLHRLARYKQLCSAEEFTFTQKNEDTIVEVSWPFSLGEAVPPLIIDAVFALVLELGRRGTKTRLTPKRVELTRAPQKGNGLEEYFGCKVRYRCTRDAMLLHTTDVDLPFITHNEELLQMLTPRLDADLEQGQSNPSITAQVKWVLKRMLAGSRPDIVVIAKELGMSERTLQRRITDEGSSFRQLLTETRQEMVRQYLSNDAVEIAEVAFLLGYEEPNSFYRAFRAWEGTTPAEWRVAHQST